MSTQTLPLPATATRRWIFAGRAVTTLPVLFLTWDGVMKLLQPAPVVDAFARLEIPVELSATIGVVQLICVALYVLPRTAVVGAMLLTGYLGGAVMTHLRIGDPLFSHTLFPTYVGGLVWLGLYLREARLRALVPLRGRSW
jgi:hypothetical protein